MQSRGHGPSASLVPLAAALLVGLAALGTAQESRFLSVPCAKLFPSMVPMLRPCSCYLVGPPDNGTGINCDRVAFQGNFPLLPYRQRIHRFSQRHAGVQDLEAQLFTASGIPLRVLDLSHNRVRRLTDRMLEGVHNTLEELHLGFNLLGDQLSPVFASNELRRLRELRLLDLSYNLLQGIDSGVFKGIEKLEVLHINGNNFEEVPSSSLVDLPALTWLSLDENRIEHVPKGAFPHLSSLQTLNLTSNKISVIEDGAFATLPSVHILLLAGNRLKTLPGSAFDGLNRLTTLDLSNNFMVHIPTTTLRRLPSLKMLAMSANKIRTFNGALPSDLRSLEYLDLGRNEISQIEPGSFEGMKSLKVLKLDVNQIRKVDASTFRGLENLESIHLNDNQLLVFPSALLSSLQKLQKVHLDYNRIAVLSPAVVSPGMNIRELSLAYNLIAEIPNGTFKSFPSLETLNLRGNKISTLSSGNLGGLQKSLMALDLGDNGIVSDSLQLDFPNLQLLSLGMNKLTALPSSALSALRKLKRLDLRSNQIRDLPVGSLAALRELQFLDLGYNNIAEIRFGALSNLVDLRELSLTNNFIRDMNSKAFANLTNLATLDLSKNRFSNIRTGTFDNLPALRKLQLQENELNSFKAELFTRETGIEELDLSHNQIAYLYPDSFTMHQRLRKLDASHNKLSFFPSEIIRSIWSLEHLSLGYNKLHTLEDSDFADLPNLRHLELQHNQISGVGDRAFQNSTQLRQIQLQHNQISQLGDKLFQGISQVNLDLSYNHLSALPSDIFSRLRDFKLESINLAHNQFSVFPTLALRKQYSFLERANFSNNNIEDFPSNADVLVNIKELDVSNNPLSPNAHHVLLAEPKSVRFLHLANTGIRSLPLIESPFLRLLNLSGNAITTINSDNFQKTTLLEVLDLSNNEIPNLSVSTVGAWNNLEKLRKLDISGNPIAYLIKGDLEALGSLEEFRFSGLPKLSQLECEALIPLSKVSKIDLYGYPSLQSLETRKCLEPFEGLESLGIEIKDRMFKDQLQKAYSPRLNKLFVTGSSITGLSSSAFAGIRSPEFRVSISGTGISDLPTTIFLPLPLSTKRILTADSNQIKRVSTQLLAAIDSKQAVLRVGGIQQNPITCDCNLLPFWRWIQDHQGLRRKDGKQSLVNVACVHPHHLNKILVSNLQMDDLFCDDDNNDDENEESPATPRRHKTTTGTSPSRNPTTTNILRKTTAYRNEPDIIFEAPTTTRPRPAGGQSVLTKVDTMIIGIVAGVVAFVCILIMIICIVRLRRSRPRYTSGPVPVVNGHVKCTCLKPPPSTCTCFPPYAVPLSYHPVPKMMGPPSMYNTMSRSTAYFGAYESDVDHR
uniref:LRRCT domain-containing protein n=1 Tax=Ixodes ricinus TaxID=34613 RepID=A0A147BJ45_IXORI